VRSALHRAGLRFRVDHAVRLGGRIAARPDLAFTRVRIAVFMDGCYWHGCPVHGRRQWNRNAHYWVAKIARNVERDRRQDALLEAAGWTVLRFWDHEDPAEIAFWIELVAGVALGGLRPPQVEADGGPRPRVLADVS